MFVTVKPFRYRGVSYKAGDPVPAEKWANRKALVITRRIRQVSEPILETSTEKSPLEASKLKRAELNEYATSLGIENSEDYANRELLLAEVEKVLRPPEKDDSGEDEDPFADLGID